MPLVGPHREDSFWIDQLPHQGKMFGFPPLQAFPPDRWLDDGDTVKFGNEILEVLHCPGDALAQLSFNPTERLNTNLSLV